MHISNAIRVSEKDEMLDHIEMDKVGVLFLVISGNF